jgi:hypothetical protein
MTIQTDGPRFGAPLTITEIQDSNAARDRQMAVDAVLVLAAAVVAIGVAILAMRAWRRLKPQLSGAVRMSDPS